MIMYITDAAREYAKKHIAKDAKHTFEEIENYLYDNTSHEIEPITIEAFKKNGNDYIRVANEYFELTFIVNYDEDSKIENLSMLDLTRKNLRTGEIDHPELGNKSLSKVFGLLLIRDEEEDEELRQIMRNLYKDKYDALDKIDAILNKFHEKWNDETGSAILKKYHLHGPGSLDEFSPSLFDDYEYYSKRPSDDEIEDMIDEYISAYTN